METWLLVIGAIALIAGVVGIGFSWYKIATDSEYRRYIVRNIVVGLSIITVIWIFKSC